MTVRLTTGGQWERMTWMMIKGAQAGHVRGTQSIERYKVVNAAKNSIQYKNRDSVCWNPPMELRATTIFMIRRCLQVKPLVRTGSEDIT